MASTEKAIQEIRKIRERLTAQIQMAEDHLKKVQTKIREVDSATAKAKLKKFEEQLKAARAVAEAQVKTLSVELKEATARVHKKTEEFQSKAKTQLSSIAAQVKAIAEAERAKRRGGRRSE